jgi:hypothetical protein
LQENEKIDRHILRSVCIGTIWCVFEVTTGFTARQHIIWIHQQKSIDKESFTKEELSNETRKITLSLKDQQRVIAYPISILIISFLLNVAGKKEAEL